MIRWLKNLLGGCDRLPDTFATRDEAQREQLRRSVGELRHETLCAQQHRRRTGRITRSEAAMKPVRHLSPKPAQ